MGDTVRTNSISVPIRRKEGTEDLPLPAYMSEHASGMDLYAAVEEPVVLQPGDVKLIPTGLFIALPPGFEAQIRPRSGLALKHGITVANTPGTIDADYRGEIGIILSNISREPFTIQRGERIAQMVIQKVERVVWDQREELDVTDRDDGGFGHTGR